MGEDVGTSTAATVNDWRASQHLQYAFIGGDDNCDGFANAKGERLSWFGLPNIQRVLYAACTAGLAWRIPKSGQLHQIH